MEAPHVHSHVRYNGTLMRVEAMYDYKRTKESARYLLRELASGVLRPYELMISTKKLEVVRVPSQPYKLVDFVQNGFSVYLEHDSSSGTLPNGTPFALVFSLTSSNPLHDQILEKIRRHCDITMDVVVISNVPYVTGFISVESEDLEIQKLLKKKEMREQRKRKAAERAPDQNT